MTEVIEWIAPLHEIFEQPFSRDIYYAWVDGETNPWIAHVCRDGRVDREWRWIWAATRLHTVVAREPLHLEASIGWQECCGRHGFIRGGAWEAALPDDGWHP